MDRERAPNSDLRYALSGAAWALVAALLAGAGLAQVVAAKGLPVPLLAVGRLQAAYLTAMLLGAVALPLAGAGLRAAGSAPRHLLGLWNGGLALGMAALLSSGLAGEAAIVAPWSAALVACAAVWWLAAMWGADPSGLGDEESSRRTDRDAPNPAALATARDEPVAPWYGLALIAGIGIAASLLLLGPWLGGRSPGLEQAAMRALFALGLVPAAWSTTTFALGLRGDTENGRMAWLASVAWIPLAVVASARPLTPDLLPAWLGAVTDAAAALAVIPAGMMALALVGSWRSAANERTVDRSGRIEAVAERTRAAPTAVAAALLITAAIAAEGLLQGAARHAVRFASWEGASALFPPCAGMFLVAAACSTPSCRAGAAAVWCRRARWVAIATAALGAAALWPLGVAEAAGGFSAEADRAQALARMAWAIGLAAYGACRLNAVRHEGAAEPAEVEHQEASAAGRVAEAGQPVPAVPHQPVWPRRGQIAAYTITAIVAGLFLILFLPAASSTAALPTEAPGPALGIDPVLAETGRLIYRRDGCAACHTQRVMAGDAGRGWGPMTGQDTPPARAAAGARRAGPDLAWVGDRFPTQREMEERLQVHGPEGPAAPHAWLFGPAPTVSGAAVAAYLASQRSSRAP